MSISKTRAKLVEVARELFARKGIESTTMNDIAQASGKGRRTLYTYFRSKEEVFYAVIEGELELLSQKMDAVAAMNVEPIEKVFRLIYTHLRVIRETGVWLRPFCNYVYTMPPFITTDTEIDRICEAIKMIGECEPAPIVDGEDEFHE